VLVGCGRFELESAAKKEPVVEQKAGNAQDTLRYWNQMEAVSRKHTKNHDPLKSATVEQDKSDASMIDSTAADLQLIPVEGVDPELLDYSMKIVTLCKKLIALLIGLPKGMTFGDWISQHPAEMQQLNEQSKSVQEALEPLRMKLSERYSLTFPPLNVMSSNRK
jgi:hypothetical protein